MIIHRRFIAPLLALAGLSIGAMAPNSAYAVPSFARQTGMPCEVCHTVFPELTPFGRLFKLNGYVLTGLQQIEAGGGETLKINASAPLSVMLQTSMTHEGKRAPGLQNDNIEFPNQFSLFYAGEISPHMGAFAQVTYDQAGGTFGIDNTDVRYANHFKIGNQDAIYGLTFNNNPTVEDVWNSTPAWRFPWMAADVTPYHSANATTGAPGAPDTMIDSLAQNVAGLGAYTLIDSQWYAALTFYRTAIQGSGSTVANSHTLNPAAPALAGTLDSISGLAPYARLAWQHQFNNSFLEVGAFGMQTRGVDSVYALDKYTDTGVDTQYELPLGSNLLALHAMYQHEDQNYGHFDPTAGTGSGVPYNQKDHLNGVHVDGVMHFSHTYEVALGYDTWSGSGDPNLYAWGDGVTNQVGKPDTNYWTVDVSYLPWENTKLGVQYVDYTKYVGSTTDMSYDNNLFLYGWFVW